MQNILPKQMENDVFSSVCEICEVFATVQGQIARMYVTLFHYLAIGIPQLDYLEDSLFF